MSPIFFRNISLERVVEIIDELVSIPESTVFAGALSKSPADVDAIHMHPAKAVIK